VNVAYGQDVIQDGFLPVFGTGDPLQTGFLLAFAAQSVPTFPGASLAGNMLPAWAAGSNVVVLSPGNAAAFPTSDAVNDALDGLLRVAKSAR
jgi:hypothetical protein